MGEKIIENGDVTVIDVDGKVVGEKSVEGDIVVAETTKIVKPQIDLTNLGFKRVDFNNPATIMSYGEDVLNEMAAIVTASAKVSRIEEVSDEKFYSAIESLRSFVTDLDAVDEKRNEKPGLLTRALVSVGSIFKPEMKKSLEPRTYADEFAEYDSTIDEIEAGVQKQGENTFAQFQFTRDSINKMKPLIEKLDKVLQIGGMDRNEFDATVVKRLEAAKDAEGSTEEDKREYNEKNIFLTSYDEQLDALGSAYVKFNNIVNQWNILQQGDFSIMKQTKKYLGTEVPTMRAHGQVVVTTRRQGRVIQRQNALLDAGSEILMQTSDQINENISGIIELEKKSMDMAPADYVAANVGKGLALYEDAKKAKLLQMEENKKHVEQLKRTFNEYSDRLGAIQSLSPESARDFTLPGGKQKSLGTRPISNKRKKWF